MGIMMVIYGYNSSLYHHFSRKIGWIPMDVPRLLHGSAAPPCIDPEPRRLHRRDKVERLVKAMERHGAPWSAMELLQGGAPFDS